MTFKVAIIGQGYVGLPLSIATATNGIKTIGIDTDSSKVSKLNHCKSMCYVKFSKITLLVTQISTF